MDNQAFFDLSYASQLANKHELDEYDAIASTFDKDRQVCFVRSPVMSKRPNNHNVT